MKSIWYTLNGQELGFWSTSLNLFVCLSVCLSRLWPKNKKPKTSPSGVYVENMGIGVDVKVLVLTLAKVLKKDGICQEGHATCGEFMGDGARAKARKG